MTTNALAGGVAVGLVLVAVGWLWGRGAAVRRRAARAGSDAYGAVFAQHPEGLVLIDAQGSILDLNAAAERAFGLARVSLVGRKLDSVRPGLAALGSEPVLLDTHSGSDAPAYEVFATALASSASKLLVLRDVSPAHAAEEALRRRVAVAADIEEISRAFLRGSASPSALSSLLARLGQSLDASRVVLLDVIADGVGVSAVPLERWQSLEARPWPSAAPPYGPKLLARAREAKGFTGRVAEIPTSDRGDLEVTDVDFVTLMPVMTADAATWVLALEWQAPAPAWLPSVIDTVRVSPLVIKASTLHRRSEEANEREKRFQHALLQLTRDLLQREVSPRSYDVLLARAADVIPGVQGGSLWLRGAGDRFRAVASLGFSLSHLADARFDEEAMLPARSGAVAWEGTGAASVGHVGASEPATPADRSSAVVEETAAAVSAGPIAAPGSSLADGPVVVRGEGLEHGVGAVRAAVPDVAPPRSTVLVPVMLGRSLRATLRLDNLERADAFGTDALRMAEAFGVQVAVLLQRVGLDRRRDRAARMSALVADIERLLLVSDRLDSFFPLLAQLVLEDGEFGITRMAVFRSTTGQVRPQAFDEHGRRDLELEGQLLASTWSTSAEGALRSLADPVGPAVCEHVQPAGEVEAGSPSFETPAAIAAYNAQPVMLRGAPWGVIMFCASRPMHFDPQLRETLTQVASSIELALIRQEDRERIELQLDKMKALVNTNEAMRGASRRREAVERALRAVLETTPADHCELMLFDVTQNVLRVIGSRRRGSEGASGGALVSERDTGPDWQVYQDAETLVLRDDRGVPWAPSDEDRSRVAVGYVGTPLRNREGTVVGVLSAVIEDPRRRFELGDTGFVEAMALACGNALDHLALLDHSRAQAREFHDLFAAADRQARELVLLDRVRGSVAKELALESLFAATVEATAEVLGYRMVALYGVEEEMLVLRHQVGWDHAPPRVPLNGGVMGRVAREGHAALASDTAADPDMLTSTEGMRAEVAAPVMAHGSVVAVIHAESADRLLDEADLRLMTAVGDQLGVAVERAALYGAVHESEQRFRLLAEHMTDMVALHSPDFTYEYVSPSSRSLLGYAPEELVGRDPYTFIHEQDRDVARASGRQRLMEGALPTQLTFRVRHANGHYVWIESAARPVLDESGEVEALVTVSRDVSARKEIENRLVHDALYDSLTGLPNRVLLNDRIERALARTARSEGAHFAVLFLDLDRFKVINDSLGHNAGDDLLRALGARLKESVRDADTVARLGGDEFCVLIEELTGSDHATTTATRILRSLTQSFNIDGHEVFVSASIGIAYSSPNYSEPQEVLRDADIAMYRAKARGKARFAVFDNSMHEQAFRLMQLESSLHRAINQSELFLEYQPIYRLADGSISGFEALVRWNHPERGRVSPDDFIPLAEESGLIVSIDRWVLAEATRQVAEWDQALGELGDISVSVNVSARHLSVADVSTLFAQTIVGAGVHPKHVRLEVTESALMENPAVVAEVLAELRDQGVMVQVDDFGTGYSSLSYLHRLPIDSLKVDGSFVQGIDKHSANLQIVNTIVTLAHNLGIEVVAEGIETAAELEVLVSLGCDRGQGYYFARPLAPERALDLLRSRRVRPTWTNDYPA